MTRPQRRLAGRLLDRRRTAGPKGAVVAGVVAAALLVTACGGEDDGARLDPQLTESAAPTATLSADETARQQALTLVDIYVDARNTVLTDPTSFREAQGMEGSAEGTAVTDVKVRAGELFLARRKQRGETAVVGTPEVVTVDLSPDPETGPAGSFQQHPYVEVSACLDDSRVTEVTAAGGKVKGASAGTRRTVRLRVVNRSWPTVDQWRVAWLKETRRRC